MTADTRNSSSSSSSSNSSNGSSISSSYSSSKNNVTDITSNLQHIHIEKQMFSKTTLSHKHLRRSPAR
jgi:hypothetical protein